MGEGFGITGSATDIAWLLRELHELNAHLATYPAEERNTMVHLDEDDKILITTGIDLLGAIHEDLHQLVSLTRAQLLVGSYSTAELPDGLPEPPNHEVPDKRYQRFKESGQ